MSSSSLFNDLNNLTLQRMIAGEFNPCRHEYSMGVLGVRWPYDWKGSYGCCVCGGVLDSSRFIADLLEETDRRELSDKNKEL